MTTLDRERLLPPKLSPEEAEMARVAQRVIMASLDHSRAASIQLQSQDGSQPSVQLPPQALRFIGDLLGLLSDRQPVVLIPGKQELSTVEAAHMLNVSRSFVIKEIESGALPHRLVGKHRRILYEHVREYALKTREKQQAALDRMAQNARALGLDY